MKAILIAILVCSCGDDTSATVDGATGDGTDGGGGDAQLDGTPDGRTDDSLPPQPMIPGGTFFRSYDGAGFTDMGYPATVSSFALDEYEVTVARFRVFAASTSLPTTPLKCSSGSIQGTWTDAAGVKESFPIDCITWTEANAFCAWDGGRLPTEAEWNYAAAGGNEQREFPWGSAPLDAAHSTYGPSLTVVGSKPAGDGRWGHADLSGNVGEWVLDWYAEPYTNPCVDCANTTPTTGHSYRGGGIGSISMSALTASGRRAATPDHRSVAIGVRCARSL